MEKSMNLAYQVCFNEANFSDANHVPYCSRGGVRNNCETFDMFCHRINPFPRSSPLLAVVYVSGDGS